MPRGYLKNTPRANRKTARGGGSRRSNRNGVNRNGVGQTEETRARGGRSNRNGGNRKQIGETWRAKGSDKQHQTKTAEAEASDSFGAGHVDGNCSKGNRAHHCSDRGFEEEQNVAEPRDDSETDTQPESEGQDGHKSFSTKTRNGSRKRPESVRDCPICFENKPVVRISELCQWHEAACIECLRCVYVTQAQKSSRNYPMRCFHPLCRKPIRATQLLKHNLIKTEKELKKHYRLTELGKGQTPGWCSVLCPHCDHPRAYKNKKTGSKRVFSCLECGLGFMIHPFPEIANAIENYGEISGDVEWAYCPGCEMLVTKEDGDESDNTAACVCGTMFSWDHAQRYPFGKPANYGVGDLLYLYW